MDKLRGDQIQSLSDAVLNRKLFGFISGSAIEHYNKQTISPPSYHNSLDAQFELAEEFGIRYGVKYDPTIQLFDKIYVFDVNGRETQGETKRKGAESLFETLQNWSKQ